MWGIPRAADAEPEACDELLARIAATHALYTRRPSSICAASAAASATRPRA